MPLFNPYSTTIHKVVTKMSDESIDTSTTLQNDNDLIFPVLAGETWSLEICLVVEFNTLGQIKVGLDGPTMSFVSIAAVLDANGSTPAAGVSTALTSGISLVSVGATAGIVKMHCALAPSANGNVVIQWAQAVSNAGATAVKGGSFLIAHKIS